MYRVLRRCSSSSEDNADDASVIATEIQYFELPDQIDLGEMSPQFRPIPCTKI